MTTLDLIADVWFEEIPVTGFHYALTPCQMFYVMTYVIGSESDFVSEIFFNCMQQIMWPCKHT